MRMSPGPVAGGTMPRRKVSEGMVSAMNADLLEKERIMELRSLFTFTAISLRYGRTRNTSYYYHACRRDGIAFRLNEVVELILCDLDERDRLVALAAEYTYVRIAERYGVAPQTVWVYDEKRRRG